MCTFCSDLGATLMTPYQTYTRGRKVKCAMRLNGNKLRVSLERITCWSVYPNDYVGSFEIAFCPVCGRGLNRKDETNGRI